MNIVLVKILCYTNLDGKQAFLDLREHERTRVTWIFTFQEVLDKDRAVSKENDLISGLAFA